jgi:hypothetical protein
MQVGIFLDELGRETIKEAQHIINYQHLSITACPGSDSNRGDGYAL